MNRRILIIDDQEAIHDDFRLILGPGDEDSDQAALDAALSRIGIAPGSSADSVGYELSFAPQGMEGFQLAKTAREAGRPFAVAFVDVRMPPGWDGVETLARIAEVDREIQCVAMTAYSDRDRRLMIDSVGDASRLLFLKKPFAAEEVEQLALALSERWNHRRADVERARMLESSLDLLRATTAAEDRGAEAVATSVLNSLVSLSGAKSGAILHRDAIAVKTPDYNTRLLPEVAPPASVADFANIPGGSAMRLTERDVLVLENPAQVQVAPDLLHLVASAFAQVLRTARHGERRLAAEREAAMGRALAQVAHDFKGHIFSLLGFSELLEGGTEPERAQITRRIGDVARDMKSYVDDLLEYADSRRGLRKSRVNLMELARRACVGNHACEVQVRGPAELPATVDAIKLERALRNLVSNAVDKAPDEGGDYRVTVTVEESVGAAHITVEDNGRPVDPAVREALFEPMVSHGKPAGTGLGLAIAWDFVHRHGGELTLEETRQGCNRFRIHIPRAIETAAA